MKAFRMMTGIAALAGACTLLPSIARADDWNKKTVLKFDKPVEIPNLVLPAGTYVFKRADNVTPNLVQILNADETHVYATLLTAPDFRREASDETVVTFKERSATAPQAIRGWFYPDDTIGEEFLYPNNKRDH